MSYTVAMKTFALPRIFLGCLFLGLTISAYAEQSEHSIQTEHAIKVLVFDYMPISGNGSILNQLGDVYCQHYKIECHFLTLPAARAIARYGSTEFPLIYGSLEMLPLEKREFSQLYPLIRTNAAAFYLENENTRDWAGMDYAEVKKRQLRIGMVRGFDDEIRFFKEELGLPVVQVNKFEQLIKMLVSGRIDIFAGTILHTHYNMDKHFPQYTDKIRFLDVFSVDTGGLVYTKDSLYAREGNAQRALEFIASHPKYKTIIEDAVSKAKA